MNAFITFLEVLGELIFGTSHVSESALWAFLVLCGLTIPIFIYALSRSTNLLLVLSAWVCTLYIILGIPLAHESRFSECKNEVIDAVIGEFKTKIDASYCRYKENNITDEWGEWNLVGAKINVH